VRRPVQLLLLLCVLLSEPAVAQVADADEPEANPGRPTVSTPATLTPVGYVQFESGFTAAGDSPEFSSRYSFNEVMKFSLTRKIEAICSAEPIAHFTAGGTTANRAGDVLVGAQGIIYPGKAAKPTLAISYLHRVYQGEAADFDVGGPANSLLLLASAEVKGFHSDANAFFSELTEGPVRRAQFGQSLTISHPLLERFTVSGEIWHFTQPFLGSRAIGNLWAVSYTARRTLVFDVGVNRGLTSSSTSWEAFAGFTYLLPHRLW